MEICTKGQKEHGEGKKSCFVLKEETLQPPTSRPFFPFLFFCADNPRPAIPSIP